MKQTPENRRLNGLYLYDQEQRPAPTKCARCSMAGNGWKRFGGTFEGHHPIGRNEEFRILTYYPVCPDCHRQIHAEPNRSRDEGWLVKIQQYDIFGNRKPRL